MGCAVAHRPSIGALHPLHPLQPFSKEKGRVGWQIFFFFFRLEEKKNFLEGPRTLGGRQSCKPCKACRVPRGWVRAWRVVVEVRMRSMGCAEAHRPSIGALAPFAPFSRFLERKG